MICIYPHDLSHKKESKPLSPEFKGMLFKNLSFLIIQGCKTLKFIFSASTSRTLQKLKKLEVLECEELVSIIEDVEENKRNKLMAPHQRVCFPELFAIVVKNCQSLKCLFSISSCDEFPRLLYANIEDAPQLLHAFERNQGEGKKLAMEAVFPELFAMRLVNLPTLNAICQGIDFQTMGILHVIQCPAISLSPKWCDYSMHYKRAYLYPPDEGAKYRGEVALWCFEDEEAIKRSQKDHGKDSTMNKQNNGSTYSDNNEEASKEIIEEEDSMNLKGTFGEGPSLEKYDKTGSSTPSKNSNTSRFEIVEEQLPTASSDRDDLDRKARSSTHSEITIPNLGTSAFTNESCEKESKGDQEPFGEATSLKEPTNDLFTKETYKKVEFAIPPSTSTTTTEKTSLLDPSISTLDKSQIATPITHTEPQSSQCPQVEIMVNHETPNDVGEIKFEQKKSQVSEEHDLMRLFQIMKEGADMEAVVMPNLSKIIADLQHDKVVSKAFTDLEGLLKMNLSEIACSEESKLRLENALNVLSSHCSEDEAPSHGLQATIHYLQQEIQTLLSSFNRASATIETFTKLEQKEKLMTEQRSKREKDAQILLSDINTTKDSIVEAKNHVTEAQLKEVELKEQISKLQAELRSKEKEIEECERKLLYLQEQEKKSVSDTIGFTMEFLAMEKERSHLMEDQLKARQQLENMEAKWSSCLSNLKKTTVLLGVHLKQRL